MPRLAAVVFDFYGVIRPDTVEFALRGLTDERGKDVALLNYVLELRTRFKTGLLSNADAGMLERYFKAAELKSYFDAVAVSGLSGLVKPQAAAYNDIAVRLGLPPQACLMVDDNLEFCQAAAASGMRFINYTSLESLKTGIHALT